MLRARRELTRAMHLVFRELLQNSDDAAAKAVEIRFETKEFIDSRAEAVSEGGDAGQSKRQRLDRKAAMVCTSIVQAPRF